MVFLVALALSLGIAIPAAGLTVVVAGLVADFGWGVMCLITVAAGVLQVLLGLSRVARAALAISPVVVHAMLAGIGITIALQQAHVLLGTKSKSTAWHNLTNLPGRIIGAHRPGVLLGALAIVILIAWRWVPARLRFVPGPLVAIVAVTVISVVFPFHVRRIDLDNSPLAALRLPDIPHGNWGAVAIGVITVALIASVESLLSAVSVDRMHNGPRTDFDRELLGQGAANIVSGTIGGLPVTGVIVRSSTNVNAGARSRASSVMHGFWILLFTVPFAELVEEIPPAALAGLLIVIGIQLLKPAHSETAMMHGDLAVHVVTAVSVVFLNLLRGVLIGLALAITLTGWRVIRARIAAGQAGEAWQVTVEGAACTFLALPRLTRVLASVPAGSVVTGISVHDLDHAAHQAITDWQRQYEATGGTVFVRGTAETGHLFRDVGRNLIEHERPERRLRDRWLAT